MKQCPTCGEIFDDIFTKCRDGTSLVPACGDVPGAVAVTAERVPLPSVLVPATLPKKALKGCPRCGSSLKMLDKPWIGMVAVPIIVVWRLPAVFVVGAVLGFAVILCPVSCRKCGTVPFRELSSRSRALVVFKKFMLTILLAIILMSAYACLMALKQL